MRVSMPDLAAQWERLRPDLAFSFPFELDTFQKEAILHLEQASAPLLSFRHACKAFTAVRFGSFFLRDLWRHPTDGQQSDMICSTMQAEKALAKCVVFTSKWMC